MSELVYTFYLNRYYIILVSGNIYIYIYIYIYKKKKEKKNNKKYLNIKSYNYDEEKKN